MFYAQGVKANVIFFDNHEASPNPWTKQVWYYDYRTNIHHTNCLESINAQLGQRTDKVD